jgi:hypothetical protein
MVKDPNTKPHFEANSDLSFYEGTITNIYNHYHSKLERDKNKLRRLQYFWPFIISGGLSSAAALAVLQIEFGVLSISAYHSALQDAIEAVDSGEKALNWFTEVNNEWEVIIGAKSYRAETVSGYNCTSCRYYPGEQSDPIKVPTTPYVKFNVGFTQDYRTCLDFECQNIEPAVSVIYHPELLENDGVVTRPSASELPYATERPIRVYPREFEDVIDKGSSHMQIRNDEGIKEHLNKALNGDYGHFFYTKRFDE